VYSRLSSFGWGDRIFSTSMGVNFCYCSGDATQYGNQLKKNNNNKKRNMQTIGGVEVSVV